MTFSRLSLWTALVAACGGCSNAILPDPPESPSREEVQELGAVIDNHTQDLLLAFNVQELLLFELPLKPRVGSPSGIPRRLAASCPTVDNDEDLDGDGVPDNAVFTFAGEECTVTIDSVGTFYQSGSIHIFDTGEAPGYHLTFDHFRIRRDFFGSSDYAVTEVNGTYDVSATDSSATLVEVVSIATEERTEGELASGLSNFNWTAFFAASDGGFVDLSIPLPSGTLTVRGNTNWQVGPSSFPFNISTVAILDYDSRCRQGPEFLSGRIQAAQSNIDGSLIHVQYLGCAIDPRVTRTTLFP